MFTICRFSRVITILISYEDSDWIYLQKRILCIVYIFVVTKTKLY